MTGLYEPSRCHCQCHISSKRTHRWNLCSFGAFKDSENAANGLLLSHGSWFGLSRVIRSKSDDSHFDHIF